MDMGIVVNGIVITTAADREKKNESKNNKHKIMNINRLSKSSRNGGRRKDDDNDNNIGDEVDNGLDEGEEEEEEEEEEDQDDDEDDEDDENGGGKKSSSSSSRQQSDGSKARKLGKAVQWTEEESTRLRLTVITLSQKLGSDKSGLWVQVAKQFPGKTSKHCRERWKCVEDPDINRSEWTMEEDMKIIRLYEQHGTKWSLISKSLIGRPELSVKTRFISIERAKKRFWSAEEDAILILLYNLLGQEWTTLAKYLPSRKNNAIRSRLKAIQSFSHRLVPAQGDPAQTIPFPTIEILERARDKAINIVKKDFPSLEIPEFLLAPIDQSTGLPFPINKPRPYSNPAKRRHGASSSPTNAGSTSSSSSATATQTSTSVGTGTANSSSSSSSSSERSRHTPVVTSQESTTPGSIKNDDMDNISSNIYSKVKRGEEDIDDMTKSMWSTNSNLDLISSVALAATDTFPLSVFSPEAITGESADPSAKLINKRSLLLDNSMPPQLQDHTLLPTLQSPLAFPNQIVNNRKTSRMDMILNGGMYNEPRLNPYPPPAMNVQYFSDQTNIPFQLPISKNLNTFVPYVNFASSPLPDMTPRVTAMPTPPYQQVNSSMSNPYQGMQGMDQTSSQSLTPLGMPEQTQWIPSNPPQQQNSKKRDRVGVEFSFEAGHSFVLKNT